MARQTHTCAALGPQEEMTKPAFAFLLLSLFLAATVAGALIGYVVAPKRTNTVIQYLNYPPSYTWARWTYLGQGQETQEANDG